MSDDRLGVEPMNILLWVLQILAAILYGSSGVMKVFMFDKISHDVPSFGALPRGVWTTLGILELVCTIGLVVPGALHWRAQLTVVAATLLAIESLAFVWVHVKYRETTPLILSAVLGFMMAFVAYGRMFLWPIV
ncbi:MAG: DoxX family protein [Dokdonella sp.]